MSKIARPRSKFDKTAEAYTSKGGDILNFPYSFDEREKQTQNQDIRLAKMKYSQQAKLAEI